MSKNLTRVLVVFGMVALGWTLYGQTGIRVSLRSRMTGLSEVPAIYTAGTGTVRLTISESGTEINFQMVYNGLTSTPNVAHVHFGLPFTNGGVVFFLCGGGGKPACPSNGTPVTGVVTASDIMAVTNQGIQAGDIASVIRALRIGAMYSNAHTTLFPGGEIRGQLTPSLDLPFGSDDGNEDEER